MVHPAAADLIKTQERSGVAEDAAQWAGCLSRVHPQPCKTGTPVLSREGRSSKIQGHPWLQGKPELTFSQTKQTKNQKVGLEVSLCVSLFLSFFSLPPSLPLLLKNFRESRTIIWALFYFLKRHNFIFLPSITANSNYLS